MGQQNGNGTGEPHIPEGMNRQVGMMLLQHILKELHELEPLERQEKKEIIAQGLLNDMPKLGEVRKKLAAAPVGARWGVEIADSVSVFLPGGSGRGTFIEAACRMREAKAESTNLVIGTLTCFALLTSTTARGILAMHGVGMKIRMPYMPEGSAPEEDDQDQGARG